MRVRFYVDDVGVQKSVLCLRLALTCGRKFLTQVVTHQSEPEKSGARGKMSVCS